jgi:pilus assembly protein CpaF
VIDKSVSEMVLANDQIALLDPASRRLALRDIALRAGVADVGATVCELAELVDGFGPLSEVMADAEVTDVLVNGSTSVWVERNGCLEETDVSFATDEKLFDFVERLVGGAGARVDASRPIADARLTDGSRLHVVLPPVAPAGPLLSIRRFPNRRFAMRDLVARGMLERSQADLLIAAVRDRATIAISGATGTGKTTLLEVLVSEISDDERVVLVEETPELAPRCAHFVSVVTRGSNVEGRGHVTLDDLARASLRMRPDRIVFGEVRGSEMTTILDALATGHSGSLLTVHARSGREALDRMAALACRGAPWLSHDRARSEIASVFDVVVQLQRVNGTREVVEILDRGEG